MRRPYRSNQRYPWSGTSLEQRSTLPCSNILERSSILLKRTQSSFSWNVTKVVGFNLRLRSLTDLMRLVRAPSIGAELG